MCTTVCIGSVKFSQDKYWPSPNKNIYCVHFDHQQDYHEPQECPLSVSWNEI